MAKIKKPTANPQANTKSNPNDTLSMQALIGQFAAPAMSNGQMALNSYQTALNQAGALNPHSQQLQSDIAASRPLAQDTSRLLNDSYNAALASPGYQEVSNALKGLQNVAAYYGLEPSTTGNKSLDSIINAINTQLRNPTANGSVGMPAIPGLTTGSATPTVSQNG